MLTTTKTIAEEIADRFNHGWADAEGHDLADVCMMRGYHDVCIVSGIHRYEFDDASAIVVDGPSWDVEGDHLWSFAND